MYYTRVTEGKIEKLKKEVKINFSILIFIYIQQLAYLKVYTNFELKKLVPIEAEKSVTDIYIEEKEN